MAKTTASHFSPRLFSFLRDLKQHNDRDWFKANKARYEEDVKVPALGFIADFAPHLAKISKSFRADPKPQGGSLFRIYRDTRFAKDKSPYKTHVGIHFRHASCGKMGAHGPGFYLHLEPGEVFVGVGIWHPDTAVAKQIRQAIVDDPAAWRRASRGKRFRERFELAGESLKRPPRGFDPEHPEVEDLRRKDFIGVTNLSQKAVTSADFMKTFAAACRDGAPLIEFLSRAQGLSF